MRPVNDLFRMRRDLSAPIAPAQLPAGISLIPFDDTIAPACRALLDRVYSEGFGEVVPFAEWWPWLISDADYDPAYIDVAIDNGRVVGFCHGWSTNFIKDLVVDPIARGQGIGTALVTRALQRYAAKGHTFVDLKTETGNLRAQALYKRLGFTIVEHLPN